MIVPGCMERAQVYSQAAEEGSGSAQVKAKPPKRGLSGNAQVKTKPPKTGQAVKYTLRYKGSIRRARAEGVS